MDVSRIIREGEPIDITDIMQVMEAAKKIMRSSGNIHQWEYAEKSIIDS